MSLHLPVRSMQTKRVTVIPFGHAVAANLTHVTTAYKSSSYLYTGMA